MRTIRKLSFFVILGIVICALIFIGISSLEANSIGKKPDKPEKPDKPGKPGEPEETWAVQLPLATEGTMLYGDGNMYENTDGEVIIKVEKGGSRVRVPGGGRETVFHYYFCFKLVNPTGRFAGFQGVDLDYVNSPDEGPLCIFPGDCDLVTPDCMECFLNRHQPYRDFYNEEDNYEYFYLKFQVGQHSFTEHFGDIIEGIEDERWVYNEKVKFVGDMDWIKFRVQNEEDFPDPYEYHNVECDERNYDDNDSTNMNIWIEKRNKDEYTFHDETITCDGVWRIHVIGEDLWVQEQYTQRTVGKGKKGGTKTVDVVPLEATGNFSFYIDFIKNPTNK